tara:strand:+ start:331 stop:1506 length:1176 start_codon:yes stop_codon:yes gene_type:complete
MTEFNRLYVLNQMSGPLCTELCEGLVNEFPEGVFLITAHPSCLTSDFIKNTKLNIIRSPFYHKADLIQRFISWLRYSIFVLPFFIRARRGDLFLVTSNPPLLIPFLFILRFFCRFSYSILIYDIYPDVLVSNRLLSASSPLIQAWRILNVASYLNATTIFTISHAMSQTISGHSPRNQLVVQTIYPWADTSFLKPIPSCDNPYLSFFNPYLNAVILYSGNLGISHDIESILEASLLFSSSDSPLFLFVGGGAKLSLVTDFIAAGHSSQVSHFPHQSYDRLPYLLSLADISIVSLSSSMSSLMLPSKLFSYLASGSCILAITEPTSELAHIVNSTNCGIVVPPNKPESIYNAITFLLSNPTITRQYKLNARRASLELFTLAKGISSFKSTLI